MDSVRSRTSGRSKNRAVRRFLRLIFLLTSGQAGANSFAHYEKSDPCCSGELLKGAKSSIKTPLTSDLLEPSGLVCFAFRNVANRVTPIVRQIQAGFVRCSPNANVGGTCSLSNNLVKYVETIASDGTGVCSPKGGVGWDSDHTYSVLKVASDTWRAYIDGIAQTPDYSWGSEALWEAAGGEHTGPVSGSVGKGTGTYGLSRTWQRYNGSAWVTITSADLWEEPRWDVSGGVQTAYSVKYR